MDLSWLNNLVQNRLAQSAALSAGAALNPEGISPALNQALQPVIGAQSQDVANRSYIDMLGQMLGSGWKLTMDKEKASLAGPTNILSSMFGGGSELAPGARVAAGLGSSTNMPRVSAGMTGQSKTPNPFL